jgi:endonuclease/exonuclease/phosphatase family metal-dependent hydrolase
VQDGICSTNAKVEGANNWTALARTIAALRPDVLVLQECGDNSGNGTGSGVDSVANLTTTIGNFLHGGVDTFHGSTAVTAYVQKYAAGYDLPFVFVTTNNDGFNRNVILSRYPFLDLNGDGKSKYDDIPTVTASAWAPGGDGQVRGFQFVEIDLPNATYQGNLVVGAAHLKCCGGTSGTEHDERVLAAENVSYVVRYWYNGNGGATPDPLGKIADSPVATSVLPSTTPIVLGGDWNEDEISNGAVKGPADWLTKAQTTGGTSDGTDRDGTDMLFDSSTNFFSGSSDTEGSSKFDYVAWQDSIATLRRSSVFYSGSNPAAAQPPEFAGYPTPSSISATASDHRTVFADLRLSVADCNANTIADSTDIANGTSQDVNGNGIPDECETLPPVGFCYPGQAGVLVCPCGNTNPPGAPDRGCDNSSGTGGSRLLAFGNASLSNDTLQLSASSMIATASCIFLQGSSSVPGGAAFGDGVRCAGGTLSRLGLKFAVAGGSSYPAGGDPTISARSAALGDTIGVGQTRWYQVYYRDSDPVYACASPSTFNISNGMIVNWGP